MYIYILKCQVDELKFLYQGTDKYKYCDIAKIKAVI